MGLFYGPLRHGAIGSHTGLLGADPEVIRAFCLKHVSSALVAGETISLDYPVQELAEVGGLSSDDERVLFIRFAIGNNSAAYTYTGLEISLHMQRDLGAIDVYDELR